MTVKKKEKKLQLEGLKVIGGKDGYNPAKEKEIEEIVYTSPVKIGDKEYVIKSLSMFDIKKLNIEKKKIKKGSEIESFDYTFYTLLAVVKKWNPETKDLTIDEFEEMVAVDQFERVQAAILQLAGLKKYFKPGGPGK